MDQISSYCLRCFVNPVVKIQSILGGVYDLVKYSVWRTKNALLRAFLAKKRFHPLGAVDVLNTIFYCKEAGKSYVIRSARTRGDMCTIFDLSRHLQKGIRLSPWYTYCIRKTVYVSWRPSNCVYFDLFYVDYVNWVIKIYNRGHLHSRGTTGQAYIHMIKIRNTSTTRVPCRYRDIPPDSEMSQYLFNYNLSTVKSISQYIYIYIFHYKY